MSSRLSPWYKSERNRQGKTTPKFDPEKDEGKPKVRDKYKPTRSQVKNFGKRTVEDGHYVWRYRLVYADNKQRVYVVREKMTQEQVEDHIVQRWREVNGRGAVTCFDPAPPDGDYSVTVTGRLVQAGRAIGKTATLVTYVELTKIDPTIWEVMKEESKS